MKKDKLIMSLILILLILISYAVGWLTTVHSLDIRCDHPNKLIYITDQFNQEWIYDYNYTVP